jgi:CRP-like cAMP-binding protein
MPNIDLLLNIGTVAQFPQNHVVFAENDVGTNMYIALKGVFGVYANSCTGFPVKVSEIQPGSFFGEMAVIDAWPRSATIISEEDGAALVIEKDKLRLMFEKSPDIADSILTMLKDRAEKTAEETRRSGHNVPALPGMPEGLDTIEEKMTAMSALSRQIRLMNKVLLGKTSIGGGNAKKRNRYEPAKLLPPDYKPINRPDNNDNEETLQEKVLFCPYCNKEQEVYVPSKFNVPLKKHSRDGRVVYKNFNILLYTNIVCGNCNYTDSYQDFNSALPEDAELLHSGIQFANEEGFEGFEKEYTHTADEAVLSYYQQLYCLETVTTDPLRFAKAWIRLYWLFSDYRCKDPARQAASKAADFYSKYLKANKDTMEEYSVIHMKTLLAELSIAIRNV